MMTTLVDRFLKDSPFCVLTRVALETLFSREHLDTLFATVAQRQYTKELLFSQLVELMLSVVLRQQPSVYAAYRKNVGQVTVSDTSVYNKLDAMELGISAALVSDSAKRIAPVIDALPACLPSWLPGYRIRILDGNHLSQTERRLIPLRDAWDAPLPGSVLAVLDQQTDLVTEVVLIPDGHAQERSRLGDILSLVAAKDLWIADRNFCTVGFLTGLDQAQSAFVLRQHGKLNHQALGDVVHQGRCETGELDEQVVQIGQGEQALQVRRISIQLDQPTQDGDREIYLLSNLPQEAATAAEIAGLYRQRWTIEHRFLEMSQTLNAEPQTLAYPKAALFTFCLGLMASNAVALIKAALRAEHGSEVVSGLSTYYLALDIQQSYRGMMVAIPASEWERFRDLTAAELAAQLREMMRGINLKAYQKSMRGPKKKPERKEYKNGGHVSTQKRLDESKT